MASFPSQDDLQTHYQQDHLEPGANYLCPVCKARLNTASDLELHYATVHSSSAARSNVNVDSLVQELSELNSSLNEEKYDFFKKTDIIYKYVALTFFCLIKVGI